MKGLKLRSGTILILVFLLILPKGSCSSSIDVTIFLNPGQISPIYYIQVSGGDVVKWSFRTYNDSFNVYALAVGVGTMASTGKTSDSGSIEALTNGNIVFYFQNMGPASGYIDIKAYIKKDTIEGYHPMIFIIMLISIISIAMLVSLKKKSIKIKN